MATPFSVEHLGRVGSTQDEARSRFSGDPLLVTASAQDAGRGRRGATWRNADRAMAASLAFVPDWEEVHLPRLTLVAGLAATDVLPDDIGLKWPNDVVRGSRKIGGLLAERADDIIVVGFGLNVYWRSAPNGMGGLLGSDPGAGPVAALAEDWVRALLDRAGRGPEDWGREEYAARCVTVGASITWEPNGSGIATGVAADGSLEVDSAEGARRLDSGAVRTIRQAASGTLPPGMERME